MDLTNFCNILANKLALLVPISKDTGTFIRRSRGGPVVEGSEPPLKNSNFINSFTGIKDTKNIPNSPYIFILLLLKGKL